MNIIFLGPICPLDKIEYIKRISRYFDYPANVLEHALVDGFSKKNKVTIVSSLRLQTKEIFVPQLNFQKAEDGTSNGVVLSFYNLPFFDKFFNSSRKFRKVLDLGISPDIIFVYSTRLDDIKSAYLLKKKFKKAKVINMITDLPQFMRDGGSFAYRLMKKSETKLVCKYMTRCVDGFVLLSKYMKEYLPVGSIPNLVVEGIFHPENNNIVSINESKDKIVLYTGNLDARYGIKDLIDAFLLTKNQDFRLWLCGVGDTIEYIQRVSLKDSRINYLGVLPRNEIIMLQKQATLLVNPRHSNEEYTRFSFPSKTMEYMASGTPTLMNPLSSLPDDYKEYLYLFEDESVEGMSRTIDLICTKSQKELKEFGAKSKDFILKNKTSEIQCGRILDFIATI